MVAGNGDVTCYIVNKMETKMVSELVFGVIRGRVSGILREGALEVIHRIAAGLWMGWIFVPLS